MTQYKVIFVICQLQNASSSDLTINNIYILMLCLWKPLRPQTVIMTTWKDANCCYKFRLEEGGNSFSWIDTVIMGYLQGLSGFSRFGHDQLGRRLCKQRHTCYGQQYTAHSGQLTFAHRFTQYQDSQQQGRHGCQRSKQ